MLNKLRIRKHEVGLWFRHGDFKDILPPGAYRMAGQWFYGDTVEVIDRTKTKFDHDLIDVLIDEPAVRDALTVVELADDERALVWKNGRLSWILGPGRHTFWTKPAELEVETYSVKDFIFTHPKVEAILGFKGSSLYLEAVRVEPQTRLLLYREGELVNELGPGLYVYWRNSGKLNYERVDLREQMMDVGGQEIMTADKVSIRVNLVVTHRVIDPRKAVESAIDFEQSLYREAQLALRESVGTRSLDDLLASKDAVGEQIKSVIAEKAKAFGVVIDSVGLRDVILPGDMKCLLNEVILAQKQAEANLIRRREETAAARSQANTAKLLADNPVLARMKELEALQEILKGAKTTFVLGQGDVADQVKTLVRKEVISETSNH